jgi:hypothetical protein
MQSIRGANTVEEGAKCGSRRGPNAVQEGAKRGLRGGLRNLGFVGLRVFFFAVIMR